jgi:hypothetical protein
LAHSSISDVKTCQKFGTLTFPAARRECEKQQLGRKRLVFGVFGVPLRKRRATLLKK